MRALLRHEHGHTQDDGIGRGGLRILSRLVARFDWIAVRVASFGMSRRLAISLDQDLPARPRGLSEDALSRVFGGCVPLGSVCVPRGSACCYGTCQFYKPYPNWPGQWYCDVMSGGGE